MTKTLIFMGALALLATVAAYYKSPSLAGEGFRFAWRMSLAILPALAIGMVLGGMVQVLLPRELLAAYAGEDSGLTGLIIATLAGAVTPGGPFVAFPLVASLWKAGTGVGPLIAYLSAWSLLGLHRILIYELPILGPRFVLVRVITIGLVPILAGFIAGWLYKRFDIP
ncbi:MAG: permease [SAR324 cluster bacterium]|nr:permease [SAR324 cluster bacterium]